MQRMTEQRRVILETLRGLKSHPTADELYERVRRDMPNISLGTVYRNLDVLHRNGLVRKLDMAGTQCRFDGDLSEHHHVRCTECGRLDDVAEASPEVATPAGSYSGFHITGYRLEFEGVCPECATAHA